MVNFSNFVRGGAAFAVPLSRNPTRPCLLAAGCERSLGSRIAASCAWLGGGGDGGSSGGGGSGSASAALSSSPLGGLRSRVAARWAEGFLGASALEHPGVRPLFPLFPLRLGGIDRAVYNTWEERWKRGEKRHLAFYLGRFLFNGSKRKPYFDLPCS